MSILHYARKLVPGCLGSQAWHHVAVVCHTGAVGSVQFYIDGRPARQHCDFVERCGVTLPKTAGLTTSSGGVWLRFDRSLISLRPARQSASTLPARFVCR